MDLDLDPLIDVLNEQLAAVLTVRHMLRRDVDLQIAGVHHEIRRGKDLLGRNDEFRIAADLRTGVAPGILGQGDGDALRLRRHHQIQLCLVRRQGNGTLLVHKNQELLHSLIHGMAVQQTFIDQLQMGFPVDKCAAEIITHEQAGSLGPVSLCQRGKLEEIIDPLTSAGHAGRNDADIVGQTEFAPVGDHINVSAEVLSRLKTGGVKGITHLETAAYEAVILKTQQVTAVIDHSLDGELIPALNRK